MRYNVKWLINGEITIDSDSKENAEEEIKKILQNIATAIQGSAYKII